jgi:diguanylate cyclase (GGDEF)-like protein
MAQLVRRCSVPCAVAALLVAVGLFVGDGERVLVRGILFGLAAAVGVVNLSRNASWSTVPEFWILVGSCALFSLSNVLRVLQPGGAAGELTNGAGGVLLLVASAVFIRHVRPGSGTRVVLDGLLVGLVAALGLRELVVLSDGAAEVESLASGFTAMGLIATSVWVRAVFSTTSVPVRLFAVAAVISTIASVTVVVAGLGPVRPVLIDLPTLVAVVLIVAAFAHPTIGQRTPQQPTHPTTVNVVGLGALVLAISALPISVAVRFVMGRPADLLMVVLLFALTTSWVLRFSKVLRDWHGHSQDLVDQLHTDALTGAASRRRVMDHLDDCIARGSSATVVFIDLDDFKSVNDRWGHTIGDALLVAVAHRLRDRLDDHDLVGRLSGDEFAVVTRRPTAEVTAVVHDAFAEPFDLGLQEQLRSAASLGTAQLDPVTDSATDVLDRADRAMYAHKHAGQGRQGPPSSSRQAAPHLQSRS